MIRKAWDWFTLAGQMPTATFSETPPRPIAEVLLDMAGRGLLPRVGRAEALSVPFVLRGRNLLCSISTLPLVQYDKDWKVERLPLLEQIDPDIANVVTLAQTVEDLVFEGTSWWQILETDTNDFPTFCRHLDFSSVSVDPPEGRSPAPLPSGIDPRRGANVWVDGQPVSTDQLIRFDSPNPGILSAAGRAIKRAVLLDTTSALYSENPRPLDYFTPADGSVDPANDEEVETLLSEWKRARKQRSTAYVPAALKYNTVDTPSPAEMQLVEQMREAALGIANALGLDPEDLGISTTSRTYQNGVDRRQDRINDVLSPFMSAITDRLSMRDVTRRGYRVRFQLDDYLRADPKTRSEVWANGIRDGWLKRSEVREKEKLMPVAGIDEVPEVKPEVKPVELPANVRAMRLMADEKHTFTMGSSERFKVDTERRIIEGLALPYDRVAVSNGRRFRFRPGSLYIPGGQPARNKLLRDHNYSLAGGRLEHYADEATGLFVRYKVGRGSLGDEMLQSADDGVVDGLSVGIDIEEHAPDPLNKGVYLVLKASWHETSLTAMPAFDDARVTRVAANRDGGMMEDCEKCGKRHAPTVACDAATEKTGEGFSLTEDQMKAVLAQPGAIEAFMKAQKAQSGAPEKKDEKANATGGLTLTSDQVKALIESGAMGALLAGMPFVPKSESTDEKRQPVNPLARNGFTQVNEAAPYRFDRKGNLGKGTHDFSSDIIAGFAHGDEEALKRATDFMATEFEKIMAGGGAANFIAQADVTTLNPNIQRPDMYVDQKDYQYPLWAAVEKGTIADATPFVLPKFNTASGLVAAHTENVEPTPGTFTATAQTITPSAVSGKVEISREAWDQGGNPQLSGLIWRQMVRAWFEALEASVVTLLNAAAPTTIALTAGAADAALEAEITSALAALQFVRGGFRMRDAFAQVDLYQKLIAAKDSNGRKLFPVIGPANATGQTSPFFGAVSVGGLAFMPTWALAASGSVVANSYLFDRSDVSGWATAPRRLTFENISVAKIHVGIWGYKALAITDLTGVRRITYDPVA